VEYKLKVGEDVVPVRAEVASGDEVTLTLSGREFRVDCRRVSDHRIHMEVREGTGRTSVNAYLVRGAQGKEVVIHGVPHRILDADREDRSTARKRASERVPDTVTPPMPAAVVKVLVQEGERVERGQGVIVVSAMKMETTLRAPHAGTVRKIHAAPGEKVSPGDVLVDIEQDPAP